MSEDIIFGVCLVDFHHTRGPEVEYWYGLPKETDTTQLWPNLPFQALPDGSHSYEETFTYFTLLFNEKLNRAPSKDASELNLDIDGNAADYTTLFAISCSRQIKSEDLLEKNKDVTRSTVQKSLVVISRKLIFGQIKDKLSIVTNVFFSQRNFSDRNIIISLYENLSSLFKTQTIQESNLYVGLSLRKILHDFKKDVLVILKAMLLEKKIIFYGHDVESLCNLEFALIGLIPRLPSDLGDSGSPLLFKDISSLQPIDSFKSSDRKSILKFQGLPLHIFEKGGLFSPYMPLQQIGDLKSENTKFFTIGTSNSLLLEQKDELCQIFIDADNFHVEIIDKSLNTSLQLSYHDKKWIEYISTLVDNSWNEDDYTTPNNSQFEGSEDFIRWQFEDYFAGMLSSEKLDDFLLNNKNNASSLETIPVELKNNFPINLFGSEWVQKWRLTQNHKIFSKITDDRLFDLFPPKHIYQSADTMAVFQQKFSGTIEKMKRSHKERFDKTSSNEKKDPGNNTTKTPPSKLNVDQNDETDIKHSQSNKILENVKSNTTENASKSDVLSVSKSFTSSHANDMKEESKGSKTPQSDIWNNWKDLFNRKKNKDKEPHKGKEQEKDVSDVGSEYIVEHSSLQGGDSSTVGTPSTPDSNPKSFNNTLDKSPISRKSPAQRKSPIINESKNNSGSHITINTATLYLGKIKGHSAKHSSNRSITRIKKSDDLSIGLGLHTDDSTQVDKASDLTDQALSKKSSISNIDDDDSTKISVTKDI
ncbi:hypothetical protein TBLA_0A03810 [Henningerozyma blattae CBS 6284]|uniref:UDENN domain-containing protein n=1 Tax=Henningerozyma blattae (strain ATCC 34711 / CBS 6284 / DSM 70876 / NBRC 10599 / NRRL Y-10934 / UCD 77-7) TaxID=1071380 RepID=I2GVM7_HENB6|nr:hypothetical protein TBLA_0A03810 [Tetrapisispora blattae CBS 6284]CCH58179.1 hypothetical protein TBLA_0A03810 [Tetrapisispora blattae CBS 6284]